MNNRIGALVAAAIVGIVLAVGTTVGVTRDAADPPATVDVRAHGGPFVPLCPSCWEV
jgi:hypothetical protein